MAKISLAKANKIRFTRVILFVIGIILVSLIAALIVDVVIKNWILKSIPQNKDVNKAIGGMVVALSGYSIRRLIIDDFDKLYEYLRIIDLKDMISVQNDVSPLSQKESSTLFWKMVNLSRFAGYYLMILSIPVGVLALFELFEDDSRELRPVYAFTIGDTKTVYDDLSSFTLYLTFPHEVDSLDQIEDAPQLELLKNTILSTSSCIESKKDTIEYSIKGYASNPGMMTDNINLANSRAKYISKQIVDIVAETIELDGNRNNLKATPHLWKLADSTRMNRIKFIEREGSTNDLGERSSVEYLNRRVEVSIKRIGACTPKSKI